MVGPVVGDRVGPPAVTAMAEGGRVIVEVRVLKKDPGRRTLSLVRKIINKPKKKFVPVEVGAAEFLGPGIGGGDPGTGGGFGEPPTQSRRNIITTIHNDLCMITQ